MISAPVITAIVSCVRVELKCVVWHVHKCIYIWNFDVVVDYWTYFVDDKEALGQVKSSWLKEDLTCYSKLINQDQVCKAG